MWLLLGYNYMQTLAAEFYGKSLFVGLFSTEFRLINMVPNYIWCKNISLQSFKTGKDIDSSI